MTRRAVEEGFDSHNRADDAAMAIQTPGKPMADQDTGRTLPAPSQSVPRMVAVVLLTAAAVLGGLYLLWQAREIVGWCVGGCVIAAALNPAVQRLQQYHVKRSMAILLVYTALILGGLGIVALILPPLVEQIRGLTAFGLDLAIHPGQGDRLLADLASRLGLTSYLPRLSEWLQSLSGQLTVVAGGLLSYTAGVLSLVSAQISMLFIAFYLLLDGQRIVSAILQFVPQAQRPRVQRLLGKSADAIANYIMGNVTISVICGVAVFFVLVLLRMPFAGALALLVAILDLIPEVGATLAGVVLVLAGLFVSPFKSLLILGYFIVYQQVENYLLTPLVYGRRVQLHPLTIFLAVVLGGVWLGVPGALLAIPAAEILRSVAVEWLDSRAAQRDAPLEPDKA
jgi:predicted PurR-regulated permease PerM